MPMPCPKLFSVLGCDCWPRNPLLLFGTLILLVEIPVKEGTEVGALNGLNPPPDCPKVVVAG